MSRISTLIAIAAAAVSGFAFTPAAFAQNYPSKQINLLVSQPPGAIGDAIVRGIAAALAPRLGQNMVVDNRPGGEGVLAGQACVSAAPDGHTLCQLDGWNIALSPFVYNNMPYDTVKDLEPVVYMGSAGGGLWVNSRIPANSVEELFALAKKQPGKLNFSTFGIASSSHLYVEWLKNTKDIVFTGVSYKSALEAFRAVVAGEVDVANYPLRVGLANSKPDQVKLLAINSEARLKEYPKMPTYEEVGIKGAVAWFGIFAPKGTPAAIIDRLNKEIVANLINNDELRRRYLETPGLDTSGPVVGAPPAVFGKFIQDQRLLLSSMVKEAKITPVSR